MEEVAKVVIIGILLVFLILVLITFLVMLFPVFAGGKTKKEMTDKNVNENKNHEKLNTDAETKTIAGTDDYTLISILTAAVAAYRNEKGENNELSSFKVVAFCKFPQKKI